MTAVPAKQLTPSAARAEAFASSKEEARKEAVTLERARIRSILSSEEARGRSDLARHLALTTDTTLEAAKALLALSPAGDDAANSHPAFAMMKAMANGDASNMSADQRDAASMATSIVAAYRGSA
jgi:capsid assembly protease